MAATGASMSMVGPPGGPSLSQCCVCLMENISRTFVASQGIPETTYTMECGHHEQICVTCIKKLMVANAEVEQRRLDVMKDSTDGILLIRIKDCWPCPLCRVLYHPVVVNRGLVTAIATLRPHEALVMHMLRIYGHMQFSDDWCHPLTYPPPCKKLVPSPIAKHSKHGKKNAKRNAKKKKESKETKKTTETEEKNKSVASVSAVTAVAASSDAPTTEMKSVATTRLNPQWLWWYILPLIHVNTSSVVQQVGVKLYESMDTPPEKYTTFYCRSCPCPHPDCPRYYTAPMWVETKGAASDDDGDNRLIGWSTFKNLATLQRLSREAATAEVTSVAASSVSH